MSEKERQSKEIKEKLKQKYSDMSDAVIEGCVDDAANGILLYCNLDDLVPKLEYGVYRVAEDFIRREIDITAMSDKETGVKSIKQGDTTFELNATVIENNNTILKRHRSTLNKFRRMVF